MSPQADQAYFCEGMAEEIINGLSRVEGLRVGPDDLDISCRARTSDLGEIARLGIPCYDLLRGDPRFIEIVRRLDLPPSIGQPRLF